jgi:BMFP domain-containing protein YqiC
MINNDLLNKINEMIAKLVQDNTIANDVANNIKTILASIFSKLDLVTRQEFDVQQKLLHDARKKLEELENKIADLLNNK